MSKNLKTINEQEKDPKLLLTPKINEWMLKYHDRFTDEAMERIWKELTKPGRDRTRSFSASSAGTCLRRQELAFLGMPQKPVFPALQETFTNGHFAHAQWQARLLSANLLEDIEVPLFWPNYISKGSADGRGFVWWEPVNKDWAGQEYLVEFKTVGYYAWDKMVSGAEKGEIKLEHLKQMHRYMLVSGIRLCSYILIDKANVSGLGWREFVVEADDEMLAESQRELEELKWAAENETIHPILPHCKMGMGSEYKYCPFTGKDGPCKTMNGWEGNGRTKSEEAPKSKGGRRKAAPRKTEGYIRKNWTGDSIPTA